MSDTEILNYIEDNPHVHVVWHTERKTWGVYDGPVGDYHTEALSRAPTLRQAVYWAVKMPYEVTLWTR